MNMLDVKKERIPSFLGAIEKIQAYYYNIVPKRNTIKDLRINFERLVASSNSVFVIGHNGADLDSIGSACALAYLADKEKEQNRRFAKLPRRGTITPGGVYVVVDDQPSKLDVSVRTIMKDKCSNFRFINKEKCLSLLSGNDLLIITDVNQSHRIALNDHIHEFGNVIVVDHHDTNFRTIDVDKLFIDSKQSSASEMAYRLMKSMGIKCPQDLATLLLAGINQDTNNYTQKRNINIWALINSLVHDGADQDYIANLIAEDFFENMELNYEIIKNLLKGEPVLFKFKIQDQIGEDEEAETISTRNTMAIVVKPELSTKIELSKIANKLRDSVSLSIVIGVIEDENKKLISIHTRSNGRISAADLMNYFGGGGNPNMASAQIPYTEDIQSVRDEVLKSPLLNDKVKRIERRFKI